MRNVIYADIHVLETVPPSCINRDDMGSPKTAVYGGTTRARVSSQCWKKAMRDMFGDLLPQNKIGRRTKLLPDLLTEAIRLRDPSLKAEELAKNALETAKISLNKDKGKSETDVLFFISPSQIDALADLAVQNGGKNMNEKACQAALMATPAVDVALFGRMVAKPTSLNFDAAAQVAHAISTHTVHNEYDYFTAVDDCAPEDQAGAGHLGTVEYNSSTLYRYATVNVTELQNHLGEETPEAVRAFMEAFIRSMPSGKKNTFANSVLPNAVYVTFRRDQPINLVGAFEKPVRAGKEGKEGYVQPSIEAFIDHAKKVYHDYLGEPERAFAIGAGMERLTDQVMSLSELLDAVEDSVKEMRA